MSMPSEIRWPWRPGLPSPSAQEATAAGQEQAPTVATQLDQLQSAVADARTLIAFAVESHRKIDDTIIEEALAKIDGLGDLRTSQPILSAKEAAFWKAYQALAEATKPISAASIAASQRAINARWGPTTGHAIFAALVFTVLALLQATWVVGTNLRKSLDASEAAIAKIEGDQRPVDLQLRIAETEQTRLVGEDGKLKLPDTATEKEKADHLKRVNELKDKQTELKVQLAG